MRAVGDKRRAMPSSARQLSARFNTNANGSPAAARYRQASALLAVSDSMRLPCLKKVRYGVAPPRSRKSSLGVCRLWSLHFRNGIGEEAVDEAIGEVIDETLNRFWNEARGKVTSEQHTETPCSTSSTRSTCR